MGSLGLECSSMSLLCPENNSSFLGSDDEECLGNDQNGAASLSNFLMDFHFPQQSDESLALLISKEPDHMPREDYAMRIENGTVDLTVRSEAVDWIWKVHGHYRFGPLTAYLSISYLDRFLSSYELPKGKAWTSQLLSVACLSLAAKMEETQVPLPLDLQMIESKYVFEATTIQRMELLVLSTLNWRLLAVTPFSFIDYFLRKFNCDMPPPKTFLSKSVKLILNIIRRIELLNFNPSEIAAAVSLSVLRENQVVVDQDILFSCFHVNKERLRKCYEMIKNLPLMDNGMVISSTPHSPIGVLDAACLSYKSSEKSVESQADCHHHSPDAKRRKISRLPAS